MFYRIFALFALTFFAACSGGEMGGLSLPYQKKPVIQSGGEGPALQWEQEEETLPIPERIVKIGLLVPLSGDASALGNALMDAATLALMDKYGYSESEDLRIKVVLVPKDTKGTPEGAVDAARHVISSGAQLIVGPLFSQNVTAVASMAREANVHILSFSNNPQVAGNGVFVFGFQVEQQVERIVNYALNRNLKQIGILGPNSAYGTAVRSASSTVMQRSGLSLTADVSYASGVADAESAAKIAMQHGKKPLHALLLPEGGKTLVSVVDALHRKGISAPNTRLLGTGLWDEPEVLRSGALIGGWFVSSPPERFAAFERRFRDFFGYGPPRLSSLAYDAMALSSSLAMAEYGFSAGAITDPAGYNGPVNGIFRCHESGICERGLAVMEVTRTGARVIDPAPVAFSF